MSVEPQMILGDAITGFGGSTIRQAYAIYNQHTHGRVAGSCYSRGLRLGMFVSGLLSDGQDGFGYGSRIREIGADYFLVDAPLTVSAAQVTVTGVINVVVDGNPQTITVTVENCELDSQHQKVWVRPVGGEVPATLARAAELKLITGHADLYTAARDVVTTVLSQVHSSSFVVDSSVYLGSVGDYIDLTVQTPLPYTAVVPVLVSPPIPLAIYELSGMLTWVNPPAGTNLVAQVRLRKNVNQVIAGNIEAVINGLRPNSNYRYAYRQNADITVKRGDILYLVIEMENQVEIPPGLRLHYTLSMLSLHESF